ncbi:DUF2238 domain-containing protein [Hydrogenimonas sp.]|uniref:DUF2238 domain-containing protein n=1 Tax=Hydrogenimonas sp. TaxID=2231112 RepID=UPI00261FFA40|nr:DUF2238 domain-containing protein [Hydrogenimonas sp.]
MMKSLWLAIFFALLIWSGYEPKDRLTWVLEVAPALIGFLVLAGTYRSFRLTPLLYWLILIHMAVLMIGGHYTYAEVPFFDHLFGTTRNNYDKLGHFVQGFVPALIAREIIIRLKIIPKRGWMNFFVVCFALALSAFYELIEWWVALVSGKAAEAFLAMQGYEWDTQSDMMFALIGAIVALLFFSGWHDRQIKKIANV